ncbi:MAG: GNAT family N-acetyltransferase [Nocardioides sp.]
MEAVETSRDGDITTWEIRRDGAVVGTATTAPRRGGSLLNGLDVPPAEAPAALQALRDALRELGETSLAVDAPTDHAALTAAMASVPVEPGATQMLLDLARPVSAPPRVTLRPMDAEEYDGYRAHLVTGYADDLFALGSFPDHAAALEASEQSTQELLPEGRDTPGQHLWSAYDGDDPVGILWIHVEEPRAFIYDIEVHADRRRRGYGREVLDAGALAARELGAERLGLNVFGHNLGARTMYEQAGYDTTEHSYRIPV